MKTAIAAPTGFNFNIKERVLNGKHMRLVNARELHANLKVGRVFGTWITERLKSRNFKKNKDFWVRNTKSGKHQTWRKEYELATDVAKVLAAIENNEIGHKVLTYLIRVEEWAREEAFTKIQELEKENTQLQALKKENAQLRTLFSDVRRYIGEKARLPRKIDTEQLTGPETHLTVGEYAGEVGYELSTTQRQQIGGMFKRICVREGIEFMEYTNHRGWCINMYPRAVLRKHFEQCVESV